VNVAADARGRALVATLGYESPTYVARLDPQTGAVLARARIGQSNGQPTIDGVIDGVIWLTNRSASATDTERLSLTTLRRTSVRAAPSRGSEIAIRTLDGNLWVTRQLKGATVSYCANPVTGQARARLPVLTGDSVFLAANATAAYYTDVPVNAHSVQLERATVSADCGA
jgi:hypothetical protein